MATSNLKKKISKFKSLFTKKNKDDLKYCRIVVSKRGVSKVNEGYNRLRDNILYLGSDGTNKVIQTESSFAHEGKTTISGNLAVSLSYAGKKVCIVDLDFRRPRTHRLFGLTKENGLADYILGSVKMEDVFKKTAYDNVDLVTCGANVYNSSLLLISDKFKDFIKTLRDRYDYVILDCAPVLQVSDYIHISKVADGVLFVVAHGVTTKNQVLDAVKELNKNNVKILGSVFSMYDSKKDEDGWRNYGYKYYNAYNIIYGSEEDKK